MLKVRPADVASLMLLSGLGAQGAGLYLWPQSLGLTLAVVGTELALLGLVGVLNAR